LCLTDIRDQVRRVARAGGPISARIGLPVIWRAAQERYFSWNQIAGSYLKARNLTISDPPRTPPAKPFAPSCNCRTAGDRRGSALASAGK
jgi:hypothetical protein